MVPWSWRHLPRAGVHETPDQQCIRRLSNDLYGGDGLGNGPAQRGRNWHFGLGWVCFCNYHWSAERDPWVSKDHGAGAVRWKSRGHGHFHGFGDSACWLRRPAHAAARNFRQTTHCTASLAHVLRVVYRHRFLLSGAATGISRLVAGSPVLFGAALLPLALLIFWMIRVRFSGVYEKISTPRAAHAYPRLGS